MHPFAVELRDSGDVIGGVEMQVRDDLGVFGYTLARAYWGRGYATEAARLLVDHGFGPLGLKRIEATCSPENLASARVLTKTGLEQVDHLVDHVLVRGVWRDSLMFAIERK